MLVSKQQRQNPFNTEALAPHHPRDTTDEYEDTWSESKEQSVDKADAPYQGELSKSQQICQNVCSRSVHYVYISIVTNAIFHVFYDQADVLPGVTEHLYA